MDLSRRLKLTSAAPGRARRSLDRFAETVPADRLNELRLIVSELVTNSFRHSGLGEREWVEMKIETFPRCIRVEVSDHGVGFGPESGRHGSENGRGLGIVNHLAARWGHEGGPQTMVWAELALS